MGDELGTVEVIEVIIVIEVDVGWSGAGGQDDGAVVADGVAASVSGASGSPSVSVFVEVVEPAQHRGVGLVGAASIAVPFVDVVDVAPV
ncbi:hypothetical protein, partial [Ilumatobacter nonamiensis]|uniref:hypothetical protein n=1 Tax=Ilumatobacter nonamiensis TaxID=467093 RepID=UPI0011D1ED93